MKRLRNCEVNEESCPKQLGPIERLPPGFQATQSETYENLEFNQCTIRGGVITRGSVEHRSTARKIRAIGCRLGSFYGMGAVFDEVMVEGAKTGRHHIILDACALRHVVLKGHCGTIILNRFLTFDDYGRNAGFDRANQAFYASVDWALDIRDAWFTSLEVRGTIPAKLIRRNEEECFVLTREVAASGDWRKIDGYDEGSIQTAIDFFVKSGTPEEVVVLGRKSKHYAVELAFWRRMRDAGMAS